MKESLYMTVNGKKLTIGIHPAAMLVDVLRENLKLPGTKVGCREGECGACTVLMDGKAVNSCMVPAIKAQGRNISTIEGIGTVDNPHKLQKTFAEEGAVQCGYCTPGFIMSAYALLMENPTPTEEQIREAIAGNLCRCTGYTRIVSAVKKASKI